MDDLERMNYWRRRAREAEETLAGLELEMADHPKPVCDKHDNDGITCGWKRAYCGMVNILEGDK